MSVDSYGVVRHEVVVDLPISKAFWAFADLDKIKPREHNMLAVPIDETVLASIHRSAWRGQPYPRVGT